MCIQGQWAVTFEFQGWLHKIFCNDPIERKCTVLKNNQTTSIASHDNAHFTLQLGMTFSSALNTPWGPLLPFEALGWLGSTCLALCGFPQAWLSWKQGHSSGVSSGLLILWSVGEVLTLFYVLEKADAPLIFNYASNLAALSIICYYRWRPRQSD